MRKQSGLLTISSVCLIQDVFLLSVIYHAVTSLGTESDHKRLSCVNALRRALRSLFRTGAGEMPDKVIIRNSKKSLSLPWGYEIKGQVCTCL